MKLLSVHLFFPLISFAGEGVKADVNVNGYYRSNGTFVQPHRRSSPNNSIYDNYSYPGNYNPNQDLVHPHIIHPHIVHLPKEKHMGGIKTIILELVEIFTLQVFAKKQRY